MTELMPRDKGLAHLGVMTAQELELASTTNVRIREAEKDKQLKDDCASTRESQHNSKNTNNWKLEGDRTVSSSCMNALNSSVRSCSVLDAAAMLP